MVTRREQFGTADYQRDECDGKTTTRSKAKKEKTSDKQRAEAKTPTTANGRTTRGMKRPAARADKDEISRAAAASPGSLPSMQPSNEKPEVQTPTAQEPESLEPKVDKTRRPRQPKSQKPKANKKTKTAKQKRGPVQKQEGAGASTVAEPTNDDGPGQTSTTSKATKTWAGRWIPSDEFQLTKFNAIRHAFDTSIAKKIRSQSSFQSPWFSACLKAFKSSGIDHPETSYEKFVETAVLQVQAFLELESVRAFVECSGVGLSNFSIFFLGDPDLCYASKMTSPRGFIHGMCRYLPSKGAKLIG